MYSCDGKTEFSASLLQSSVSHDQKSITQSVLLNSCVETIIHCFSRFFYE